MRWLSPPESVAEPRLRVRYSSPTLLRNPRRSLISLRMRCAMSFCLTVSLAVRAWNHSAACRMENSVTCAMLRPLILTASASGFRRNPLQASQGEVDWKRLSSSRTHDESVSRNRRSMLVMTPSNGLVVL